MAGTIKRTFGPLALTNTYTTNVYNNTSALLFDVIRHIHIVNKTSGSVTFRLWVGATGANAAGTEIFYDHTVTAFNTFDWYCAMKMVSTDFLVGGASAATSLTITGFGEQIVV